MLGLLKKLLWRWL